MKNALRFSFLVALLLVTLSGYRAAHASQLRWFGIPPTNWSAAREPLVSGRDMDFFPEKQRLDIPFLKPGYQLEFARLVAENARLEKTLPALSDQIDSLCLIHGDKFAIIEKLNDLRGYVLISSPEDALAFVRIATVAPRTVLAYSGPGLTKNYGGVEVARSDELTAEYLFGDGDRAGSPDTGMSHGYDGVVTPTDWVELGLQIPSSHQYKRGYMVTEPVMVHMDPDSSEGTVFYVTSWVGKDGRYTLLRKVSAKLHHVKNVGFNVPEIAL